MELISDKLDRIEKKLDASVHLNKHLADLNMVLTTMAAPQVKGDDMSEATKKAEEYAGLCRQGLEDYNNIK